MMLRRALPLVGGCRAAGVTAALGPSPPPARSGAPRGRQGRSARFLSSLAAQQGGKLYTTGWGKFGQLGLGEGATSAQEPTAVEAEGPVTDVACGKKFTLFVSAGKVYAMGSNDHGELGNTKFPKGSFVPVPVEGLEGVKIKEVSAGHLNAMALSEDGEVFSWGYGGDSMSLGAGCLGLGDKKSQATPQHVKGLEGQKVVSISSGGNHAGALTESGGIFTWGNGENGRLGHGDNTTYLEPRAIVDMVKTKHFTCGDHFCAAIDMDGVIYTWGHNKVGELGHEGMSVFAQESTPLPIDKDEYFNGESIIHVGCGYQHSAAVTDQGSLYVWGSAGWVYHTPHRLNQMSPPAWPIQKRIQRLFAGNSHTAAIAADQTVLTWGRNRWTTLGWELVNFKGVLGHGDETKGWGEVEPKEVASLKGVLDVACGPLHTAFIAE